VSGLPDGVLSKQKSQFGYIFEGLRRGNVEIFYGHMEKFNDNWEI
jgi:hypothetical protein